jgi:competence protein ComGC
MKIKSKNGFTIVEVLTSVFVLSLIVLLVGSFQKNVFSLNSIIQSGLTIQQEGRKALKTIIPEIRSISSSSAGAYPLAEVQQNSITFYSDIDGDGLKERLRYFLDGDILKRGVLKPTGSPAQYILENEVVTEFVHNIANGTTSIFSYYDTNYDGMTDPLSDPVNILDVRLVEVTLIMDGNGSKSPAPVTLKSKASMRNLKDNL